MRNWWYLQNEGEVELKTEALVEKTIEVATFGFPLCTAEQLPLLLHQHRLEETPSR